MIRARILGRSTISEGVTYVYLSKSCSLLLNYISKFSRMLEMDESEHMLVFQARCQIHCHPRPLLPRLPFLVRRFPALLLEILRCSELSLWRLELIWVAVRDAAVRSRSE